MKKNEWNKGLNHIDFDLVEEFVAEKEKLAERNHAKRSVWLRWGAIAACLALIIGVVIVSFTGRTSSDIPIIRTQTSSLAPIYFGSQSSEGGSGMGSEISGIGISVTARLAETLPDVYTIYDDWEQKEYRLLRMEVVTLLKGTEMTDEFYYMVPIAYMTDFSIFDKFVIFDMAQLGYEHSVLYNKTQNCAQALPLVLFGYRSYGYNYMGEKVMAFDSNGNFDARLWESTKDWVERTKEVTDRVKTISEAEENARTGKVDSYLYAHLLEDVKGEAAKVLESIRSFENGIYVPHIGLKLGLSPEVQFNAVRYINGFSTNEKVRIYEDAYTFTKARFDENDLKTLPDLSSAIVSVANAYEKGEIKPPHIENYTELMLSSYGIFGWYAKTTDGVIGIVRVTWNYNYSYKYRDDAYYIVEWGSDTCKLIDRDDLLKKLGDYEPTYIYLGEYDKNGKVRGEIVEA